MAEKKNRGKGLGPEARVLARFGQVQLVVQIMDDSSPYASDEEGKDVSLYIKSGRGAAAINLTRLTRDELDAVGAIMFTALGLAEDVCEMRDRQAIEKEEAGDDGDGDYLWRLYRRVPEVLVRNGQVYEYDPELQLRSSWMANLDALRVRSVRRASDVPGQQRSLLDGVGEVTGSGSEDAGA